MKDNCRYKKILKSFCRMHHLQMMFMDCYMPKESTGKKEENRKVKKLVMFDEFFNLFNLLSRTKVIDSTFAVAYGAHLIIPPEEDCSTSRRVNFETGKTEEVACKKFIDDIIKAKFFHVYRLGKPNADTSLEGITSLESLKIILDLNSNIV